MTTLKFLNCENVSEIVWPEQPDELTPLSPATSVLTDFVINRPLIIEKNTKAAQAEYLMKKTHVKLKIVVDDNERFIGIVSYSDLNNQEIIKKVASGDAREDLKVSDFMRVKSELKAIEWQDLKQVTIRNLVQFLHDYEEQHALVTDNNGACLRGIVSASDVVRALHLSVNLMAPVNFSLVHRALIN